MMVSRAVVGGLCFLGGLTSGSLYHRITSHNNIHIDYQEKTSSDLRKSLFPYGSPERAPDVSYYKNFALCYDTGRKIPYWVAEHITPDKLKGDANRRHSKFQSDPSMTAMFNGQNSDYYKSGWSRGHMAPAGDFKHSQEAMNESFYLTNVLPQDIKNNGGFWNRLEMYCRELAGRYSNVWVISGPIMLPQDELQDNKNYVNYEVIGKSQVAVPSHLFKIIVTDNPKNAKSKLIASFIVPNKPIGFENHLKEYEVPLEQVEERTGFKFLPNLYRTDTQSLCVVDGCNLLSKYKFELYFIGRKIEGARTMDRLEKAWAEIAEKKLKPDNYLTKAYNRKKAELTEDASKSRKHGEK